jgi:hypothetical protein
MTGVGSTTETRAGRPTRYEARRTTWTKRRQPRERNDGTRRKRRVALLIPSLHCAFSPSPQDFWNEPLGLVHLGILYFLYVLVFCTYLTNNVGLLRSHVICPSYCRCFQVPVLEVRSTRLFLRQDLYSAHRSLPRIPEGLSALSWSTLLTGLIWSGVPYISWYATRSRNLDKVTMLCN